MIYNSVIRDGEGKEIGKRRLTYGNFNNATGKDEPVKWNTYDFTADNPTHIINNGVRSTLKLTYVPNRNVVHRWSVFQNK